MSNSTRLRHTLRMPVLRGSSFLLPCILLCVAEIAHARPLSNGRLEEILRDVKIYRSGAPAVKVSRPTAVGDDGVQTGPQSRAQISFADQTLVRIGDKTHLAVNLQARRFDLDSGAVFVQVPAGVGGTT